MSKPVPTYPGGTYAARTWDDHECLSAERLNRLMAEVFGFIDSQVRGIQSVLGTGASGTTASIADMLDTAHWRSGTNIGRHRYQVETKAPTTLAIPVGVNHRMWAGVAKVYAPNDIASNLDPLDLVTTDIGTNAFNLNGDTPRVISRVLADPADPLFVWSETPTKATGVWRVTNHVGIAYPASPVKYNVSTAVLVVMAFQYGQLV